MSSWQPRRRRVCQISAGSRSHPQTHQSVEDSPGVDLGTQLPGVLPLALYDLLEPLPPSRICEKLSFKESRKYSKNLGTDAVCCSFLICHSVLNFCSFQLMF